MRIEIKKLIQCIALPLAVGLVSSFLSRSGMASFDQINKPPLSPPGWLFPIVWTILYIFMGIASYLILTSKKECRFPLTVYGIQLIFNFFWPIFFSLSYLGHICRISEFCHFFTELILSCASFLYRQRKPAAVYVNEYDPQAYSQLPIHYFLY